MDYVREELLRQQRALEALMNGDAPEESEALQEEPARQRAAAEERTGVRRERSPERSRNRRRAQSAAPEAESVPRVGAALPEAEEPGGFAEESVGRSGSRAQRTVREVSRAIERDARRYDGGFTMY